jgi:hypothetical protein
MTLVFRAFVFGSSDGGQLYMTCDFRGCPQAQLCAPTSVCSALILPKRIYVFLKSSELLGRKQFRCIGALRRLLLGHKTQQSLHLQLDSPGNPGDHQRCYQYPQRHSVHDRRYRLSHFFRFGRHYRTLSVFDMRRRISGDRLLWRFVHVLGRSSFSSRSPL